LIGDRSAPGARVDKLFRVVCRVTVEVAAVAVLAARQRPHADHHIQVVRPTVDRQSNAKRHLDIKACQTQLPQAGVDVLTTAAERGLNQTVDRKR